MIPTYNPITEPQRFHFGQTVRQYGYRQAMVRDVFLELPRDATTRPLEESLAKACGRTPDNHTVYEIVGKNFHDKEVKTYISFSDMSVRFGREVVVERW